MKLIYQTRYGYTFRDALICEFWWRVEHVGYYRGGDGGLCGVIRSLGYRRRKNAERAAIRATVTV